MASPGVMAALMSRSVVTGEGASSAALRDRRVMLLGDVDQVPLHAAADDAGTRSRISQTNANSSPRQRLLADRKPEDARHALPA
jgi:hypothetical protein